MQGKCPTNHSGTQINKCIPEFSRIFTRNINLGILFACMSSEERESDSKVLEFYLNIKNYSHLISSAFVHFEWL